ncbi:MAG: nucleotide exchange factor GrpE [Caulobacter sp.]
MTDEQTPANEEAFDGAETAAAAETEALKAEVAALKEQVLRYAAEADNTRRRAEREANEARAYAIQKFSRDLLGVADNLSRALAAAPKEVEEGPVKTFTVGIEMTEKALSDAFERNGLKRVDPVKGSKFDPHLHQAMMEQPSTEVAAGGVIQVLQTGYELLGRLVRPAMVVVAAKGSTGIGETAPAEPTAAGNPYANAEAAGEGGSVDTRA